MRGWDLIMWSEGQWEASEKITDVRTDIATTRPKRPKGQFDENHRSYLIYMVQINSQGNFFLSGFKADFIWRSEQLDPVVSNGFKQRFCLWVNAEISISSLNFAWNHPKLIDYPLNYLMYCFQTHDKRRRSHEKGLLSYGNCWVVQ